ncbi:hypothetical protein BDF21DRAFT_400835 [Thamnidium elegans]|nr:hypothetical protein BDF21DRAFT_400835 [Thamnidium elegans]
MVVPEPLNTSKKNGGISKKKPGPKSDPHANIPGTKRLNNVDNDDSIELNVAEEIKINMTSDSISSNNTLNQATIENDDAEEGTESDEEYFQKFSNVSNNYVEEPIVQEYAEDEFEAADEEVGGKHF